MLFSVYLGQFQKLESLAVISTVAKSVLHQVSVVQRSEWLFGASPSSFKGSVKLTFT